MKVFLTGGTGFVGNYVAEKLIGEGHSVVALVRKGSEKKLKVASSCEIVNGDTLNPESFGNAISGCEAVINLVGIIREFPSKGITFERLHFESTRNVANAAKASGVSRFLQMSALGAAENAQTKYWQTKWKAEQYLESLDLDFTIFRPSVIVGAGGEFAALLKQLVSAPITPVIGNGKYKMQPISISNVAELFSQALLNKKAIGKTYEIGGPEIFTFNEMLEIAGEALGKKVRLAHFPKSPFAAATKIFENISVWPVTSDQLKMVSYDSVCDNSQMTTDFAIKPLPYRESIAEAFR